MSKQKMDCLFIHAPEDRPGGQAFAMYPAMGVFALADYLQRNAYSSKILHLGIEKILNNKRVNQKCPLPHYGQRQPQTNHIYR